jgi:hypothetical protein
MHILSAEFTKTRKSLCHFFPNVSELAILMHFTKALYRIIAIVPSALSSLYRDRFYYLKFTDYSHEFLKHLIKVHFYA